jgi:hypothetical protein
MISSTASSLDEVKARPATPPNPKVSKREFVAAAFVKVLEQAVKLGLATSQPQEDGSLLVTFEASPKASESTEEAA